MKFLPFLQIIVAIALIVLILLQERSSGLGGLLGGGDTGGTYQTRRGMERGIFIATIILAVVFAALAIIQLLL